MTKTTRTPLFRVGLILILFGCSTPRTSYHVESQPTSGEDQWVIIDSMPSMIGGEKALSRHLVYPEEAKQAGIEGEVVLLYVVDADGSPTEIRVVKSLERTCDEAAIHALKKVKFKPGMQNGQPVRVQISTSVKFRI